MPALTVIGVPGTGRVREILKAATRVAWPRIGILPWLDAIAGKVVGLPPGSLLRIESPSGCAATTRAILLAGIPPLESMGGMPLSRREIDRFVGERGELFPTKQWYLGFREILNRWKSQAGIDSTRWMSLPSAIVATFDKRACLNNWAANGLPAPRPLGLVESYEQIRSTYRQRHARLFLKPRFGYSAIGAVALEWRDSRVRAITTVERLAGSDRKRLFLSRRPRVLKDEPEISDLIDTLATDDLLMEPWLTKARWDGRPFDLRVVMIQGRMRHVVGRASASPFTNLNLGARRIARDELQARLHGCWPALERAARLAADSIPGAGTIGLDILVRPNLRDFVLLEANAFGDYLPSIMHQGESVYEAELRAISQQLAAVMI